MAEAHITTKDGSTILIEGTAEEVATLMARLNGSSSGAGQSEDIPKARRKRGKAGGKKRAGGKTSNGPAALVADFIRVGAFKKPKGLAEIQAELKQGGHYYNNASVAVALLRAVKRRELRRIKQDGNWVYVV